MERRNTAGLNKCTTNEVHIRRHSVLNQLMGFCMQQLPVISLCGF